MNNLFHALLFPFSRGPKLRLGELQRRLQVLRSHGPDVGGAVVSPSPSVATLGLWVGQLCMSIILDGAPAQVILGRFESGDVGNEVTRIEITSELHLQMLRVQVRRRAPPRRGVEPHVHVLLRAAGDPHQPHGQRVAAQGLASLPSLSRCLRRRVRGARRQGMRFKRVLEHFE